MRTRVADGRVECHRAEPQRVSMVRKVGTQRAQCSSFEVSDYIHMINPRRVSHLLPVGRVNASGLDQA